MTPENFEKVVNALTAKDCCHGCCPDPMAVLQMQHSLARFNDTSSQTAALAQQGFVQQQQAHWAHLLAIQADLTTGRPTDS